MELLIEREKVNNSLKWHKVHEKQMFNLTLYTKWIAKVWSFINIWENSQRTSLIFQMDYKSQNIFGIDLSTSK